MDDRERAEENLAVIRSMMERATVYRMISGPTALFAALVSVALVFFIPWDLYDSRIEWKWMWYGAAGLVLVVNTLLVIRKAMVEKTAVFSPGLKMGLMAILPALIIGAVIGCFQFRAYDQVLLAWIWMLCYGTALMATGGFAPRSLWWLGLVFVITGLYYFRIYPSGLVNTAKANWMMLQTFGGYHLVYGGYVLLFEKDRS